MEMHARIQAESHQSVTAEIEHGKGILGIGVSIQVESWRVFPLHETKRRVWINGPDPNRAGSH